MEILFESTQINTMTLANRFVRSATWEGMAADDGAVTPKLIETMCRLADGGIGLIITGHAYVRAEGQAGPWQLGIYADRLVDGLRDMTAAVHDRGGKIVAQLAHAGNFAAAKISQKTPWVVSDYPGLARTARHEIGEREIGQLTDAFAAAAERAREAGFDGVQIHSAHGYLLSQFLSPLFNRRKDAYGGSIENRSRIHTEIVAAIRSAVGADYPVLVKINGQDFQDGGLSVADAVAAGVRMADAGLDAIELSGGLLTSPKLSPSRVGINRAEKEAYFRAEAAAFKAAVGIPLMLVGGVRSIAVAQGLVTDGIADYISMCRPLIREPGLIKRWRAGDLRPALCVSDNMCFKPAMKGEGIFCLTEKREAEGR